jgi:hypothetical protein
MKSGNPAFVSCTDGLPGVKRGLLMQQSSISRIRDVLATRNRTLVPFLDSFENEFRQAKMKVDQETSRADFLASEHAVLLIQIENKNKYIAQLQRENSDLGVKLALEESSHRMDQYAKEALENFSRRVAGIQ